RGPAARERRVQRLVGEVLELEFLELVLRAVPRGADETVALGVCIALDAARVDDRRHALQLAIRVAGPRRGAVVADFLALLDDVAAAREHEPLAHADARRIGPGQRDLDAFGVAEAVARAFGRDRRLVIRRGRARHA